MSKTRKQERIDLILDTLHPYRFHGLQSAVSRKDIAKKLHAAEKAQEEQWRKQQRPLKMQA